MLVPFPYLRFTVVTLSAFLVLSGCFRSVESDSGVQALRDQTEKRSLRQAELAFLRADYSTAVLLLNRFLRIHPQSSQSLEARWWLARAYQKTGNLSSAVEHFRFLAHTRTWNLYQTEARLRVTQLERRLGEPMVDGSVKGTLVSIESARTPGEWDAVIAANLEIKGSMILLDLPCGVDGNPPDNGQPFSLDTMRSAVQHVQAQGTAVYLGITPRCLGHFSRDQRGKLANWKDWNYDPQSGRLRRSSYYSLNVLGYQAFLVDWVAELRELPLAGLVIRDAVPVGMYEGFSPWAVRLFAQEFGVDFDPVRMFNEYRAVPTTHSDSGVRLPAVFWKWAGWKARERLRILRNVVRTLRVRFPHLEFGITLQSRSVTDPIQGLLHFAEDWIDVARGPFDVFLITLEDPESTVVHPTSQQLATGFSEEPVLDPRSSRGRDPIGDWAENRIVPVKKLIRHLGKPENIWTILPRRAVHARTQSRILPKGVGRIYDHRGVP